MKEIIAPTNCPCCDSVLVEINYLLYCKNSDCGTQSAKKLEHFAKTLKIKGLGPASIEKLDIDTIEELYDLTEEDMAERFGEWTAHKIYTFISDGGIQEEISQGAGRIAGFLGLNNPSKTLINIFRMIYETAWFSMLFPF